MKWNAASYFYKEDIVTFNPRNLEHIHLVFHHFVVDIKSSILNGAHKNRRMTYFKLMPEVEYHAMELVKIMNLLGNYIHQQK